MSRALAFLADSALAAAVLPGPGQSLDLEGFLHETGTLYLIAETRGEDSPRRPAVRLPGQRAALYRRAGRQPDARRST